MTWERMRKRQENQVIGNEALEQKMATRIMVAAPGLPACVVPSLTLIVSRFSSSSAFFMLTFFIMMIMMVTKWFFGWRR